MIEEEEWKKLRAAANKEEGRGREAQPIRIAFPLLMKLNLHKRNWKQEETLEKLRRRWGPPHNLGKIWANFIYFLFSLD